MACRELLLPYVRWAAQDQIIDPYRYILGFTFTSTYANGQVAIAEGKMDVRSARFAPKSENFQIVLRGSGRRTRLPLPLSLEDAETTQIVISVAANPTEIRIKIGDVATREIIENFTVRCEDAFLISTQENTSHIITLRMLEQQDNDWVIVQPESAKAADTTDTPEIAEQPAPDEVAEPTPEVAPQDLQRIEGIGPQIANTLENMGVRTYQQLSKYNPEQLEAELREMGVEIKPGTAATWPAQATLAAGEKWNALKFIQEEVLKGGRVALPDNLQRIRGIGAKTAATLYSLKVTSFKDVARRTPEQLETDLRAAGLNIATGAAATWPQQAELAAQYRWVELEELQKKWDEVETALQDTEQDA